MARHELHSPPRRPWWHGRGPLIALSVAFVGAVALGVTAGPIVLAGHPIVAVSITGPVTMPPDPFRS